MHRFRSARADSPSAVQEAGHHRAESPARRHVDRPLGQLRRATVQPNQRQTQEKVAERQLALDPVGDGLFETVEDQIAGPVAERLDVVAERRAGLAKLHEVFPRPGEDLSARQTRRLRDGVPQRLRRRHEHDRLAGPRAAAPVDDPEARLQIVEALLGRKEAQERHQTVDGGEADDELPADRRPAQVRGQTRQVEPSLPDRDPLEHRNSLARNPEGFRPPRDAGLRGLGAGRMIGSGGDVSRFAAGARSVADDLWVGAIWSRWSDVWCANDRGIR